MHPPKRVMIIGQPGSGKSTLARALGEITQLPVIHIDNIHWQSGWIERSGAEKDRLCTEVHAKDKWIFEGGRSSTWPERFSWEFIAWIWNTRNSGRLNMRRFFDGASGDTDTYHLTNPAQVDQYLQQAAESLLPIADNHARE